MVLLSNVEKLVIVALIAIVAFLNVLDVKLIPFALEMKTPLRMTFSIVFDRIVAFGQLEVTLIAFALVELIILL